MRVCRKLGPTGMWVFTRDRGEAREHSPRPRPGRRWGTGQETGRGTEWPLVGASQRLEEWGGAVSPTGPTGPTGLSVAFGL